MKKWQRFKTTRMYIHPPKAERIFTLWREGKIMMGEIETPINQPYENVNAAGVWFVDSEGHRADFELSEYVVREDGIPTHGLKFYLGSLECTVECASPFERKPTLYGKLTVRGNKGQDVSEKFGFMLRDGKECELIFGAPDVYGIYAPTVEAWLDTAATFSLDGGFRSGECFFELTGADTLEFDKERGVAMIGVELRAGEEKVFYFALGKGEGATSCFKAAKASAISSWEGELKKITKLPKKIASDAEQYRMIKNLTVQLLQCFCYGKDTDALYSRQGGLQRRVWTYEAMPVLEGLMRIGDFEDYIEPTLDVYFSQFFTESGEIVPLGIHWAMATGTVLNSFGTYSMLRGKEFFLKHRDKAMRSFEWMRWLRGQKTYNGAVAPRDSNRLENTYLCVDGLFPPMSACDDPLVFQAWLSTDGNNILGLKAFSDACEMFCDERAAEVREEYEAYRAVMQSVLDKLALEAKDTDEFKIPYTPAGDVPEVTERYHFSPSMGFLTNALRPEPEVYNKIINYYTRRGLMIGGLYNKMPDKDPSIPGNLLSVVDDAGHSVIWYVCAQEYGWFKNFLEHGELDRCREIIKDSIRFAMSDEYYMLERYHESNPWYAPWSPNASCNGRMINMLLDICSEDR